MANKSEAAKTVPTPVKGFDPSAYKSVRKVTKSFLRLEVDVDRFVRIDGEIYEGKKLSKKEGKDAMEPAHICDITDLTTGEIAQLMLPSVLLSVLNEEYPEHSYVGRAFKITKRAKKEGRRYFPVDVEEIEI